MRIPPVPAHERVIWEGRSAWADQAILFIFIGAAGVRLLVAVRYGQWLTAVLYTFAMVFFVAIGAAFRYTVYYQISAERIRVLSGLWHLHLEEIPLSRIRSITVKRELLNRWFDVGAMEIDIDERERRSVLLKGVPEPERIKRQIVPLLSSPPSDRRADDRESHRA